MQFVVNHKIVEFFAFGEWHKFDRLTVPIDKEGYYYFSLPGKGKEGALREAVIHKSRMDKFRFEEQKAVQATLRSEKVTATFKAIPQQVSREAAYPCFERAYEGGRGGGKQNVEMEQAMNTTVIKDLIGLTPVEVRKADDYSSMTFYFEGGKVFEFWHIQDCCETVEIESIVGDLSDLVGAPLLMAEEVTKQEEVGQGSSTWTFYKFATKKGYVDVRWLGESNGYYSESVSYGWRE